MHGTAHLMHGVGSADTSVSDLVSEVRIVAQSLNGLILLS